MAFISRAIQVPPNSASIGEARKRAFDFIKKACRSIPTVMEIYNLHDVVTVSQIRDSVSAEIRKNDHITNPKLNSRTHNKDGNHISVSVKEGDTVVLPDYDVVEVKLGEKESYRHHDVEICNTHQVVSSKCLPRPKTSRHCPSALAKFSLGSRGLSSQASRESGDEEDKLEDGFSELESPSSDISEEKTLDESNEDSLSELELLDDDEAEDSLSDPEQAAVETTKKSTGLDLFKVMVASTRNSLDGNLNKWDEEGKPLDRPDISLAMLNLRKRRMYMTALQFSEWLESKKKLTFAERDYASRLDLIAKVRGVKLAEKYIEDIPESFRGEVIYRTLLASYAAASNVKKTEEVFNKMRDLGFQMTSFSCNQLLMLYKRLDKKKIADVLLFMEKEEIKPSHFTYRLLMDAKGQSNDITGMEQLLETMKEQGLEPDIATQALVARHYIRGGLNDKAKAVLKEMEGENLKDKRAACPALLSLYGELGKADEVGRIWGVCDSNPRMGECLAAIKAWGKVGKIEEAEATFERMSQLWKKLSTKSYTVLLEVYADNKMLAKGKDVVMRMSNSGCRIGPWTYDALVKLFVDAGEVEKAGSVLQKAVTQNSIKPLYKSYIRVMEAYARRGDIHGTEKLFHMLKQAGYAGRLQQFQILLDAYIKSGSPAYGFKERMRAEDVFPNKVVAAKLARVDGFKKTAVSDLL